MQIYRIWTEGKLSLYNSFSLNLSSYDEEFSNLILKDYLSVYNNTNVKNIGNSLIFSKHKFMFTKYIGSGKNLYFEHIKTFSKMLIIILIK